MSQSHRPLGRSSLPSRPSPSAATCSAGAPTRRPRSPCSTLSSMPASIWSTPPTRTRTGCPGTRAANRRRSSAAGSSAAASATGSRSPPSSASGNAARVWRRPPSRRRWRDRCSACRPTSSTSTRPTRTTRRHPLADTLGAFARLIEQGKVRAIGASNYSAARLAEALEYRAAPWPAALREPAAGVQPLRSRRLRGRAGTAGARAHDVARDSATTRWPAASSAASTAAPRTWARARPAPARSASTSTRAGCASCRRWTTLPPATRATPAQVALAWLMARPSITAPIASATSVAQLQELLRRRGCR